MYQHVVVVVVVVVGGAAVVVLLLFFVIALGADPCASLQRFYILYVQGTG